MWDLIGWIVIMLFCAGWSVALALERAYKWNIWQSESPAHKAGIWAVGIISATFGLVFPILVYATCVALKPDWWDEPATKGAMVGAAIAGGVAFAGIIYGFKHLEDELREMKRKMMDRGWFEP
jgi:hypothetical protein